MLWTPAVACPREGGGSMTVEVYGNDDKDMKISPSGKLGSFRVFFYLSNKINGFRAPFWSDVGVKTKVTACRLSPERHLDRAIGAAVDELV